MLLQEVPTAQVKKTESRRMRVMREENPFWGLLRKLRYRGRDSRERIRAKILSTDGKAERW